MAESGTQENPGIWTPRGTRGLVNWLPLAEGAGASDQLVPDLVTTAGATYRGETVAVEATDPTWTDEGLSFDGGDWCFQDGGGIFTPTGAMTVIACVYPSSAGAGIDTIWGEAGASDWMSFVVNHTANQVGFWTQGSGGQLLRLDASTAFVHDEWQTLSLRLNNGVAICDRNGVPGGGVAGGYNPAWTGTYTNAWIGRMSQGFTYTWLGAIAYVLRFNRVLTDAEIAICHNYIRGRVAGRGITLPAAP